MAFRNPFKSNRKVNQVQPRPPEPQSQQTDQVNRAIQPDRLISSPVARVAPPKPSLTVTVATEQTLDYLKKVELDDVLELMYPRLLADQQNGLAACTQELARLDQELNRLYTMRDDILNTQTAHQPDGVVNL